MENYKWILLTRRKSGVNTYIKVDDNNEPILEKQKWSNIPQKVIRLAWIKSK